MNTCNFPLDSAALSGPERDSGAGGPGPTVRARSALVLTGLLFYAILTLWVRDRWALSLFQAAVFWLAIAGAVRMIVRPFRLQANILLLPLGGAAGWGLLQLAANQTIYRWETWNSTLNWGTNFILFVLALQIFPDPDLRRRFRRAVVYFGLVLSVWSTIQMFTSAGKVFWLFPSGYADSVLGPFVSRNQYAAFIELILPIALTGALKDRRRTFLYAVITSVMFVSVIAGASRAGSILVSIEILVIFFVAWFRRIISGRTLGSAFGTVVAVAVLCSAVVGWDGLWHRFQQPDPYAARREMLLSSLDMVRERPWVGFGLGTWSTAYPRYAYYDDGKFVNQAHNDWAQWAVEGGLPLLLMLLWIGLVAIRPALRSLWGIGIVSLLLHSLVDYPMQRPALAGWFFVLLGVLLASTGRAAQEQRLVRSGGMADRS